MIFQRRLSKVFIIKDKVYKLMSNQSLNKDLKIILSEINPNNQLNYTRIVVYEIYSVLKENKNNKIKVYQLRQDSIRKL